jgi:putative FmdB family regulatory protein
LILYDFKCECGHVFEAFASIHDRTHECGRCGNEALRQISAARIKLEGWSGHFPTAKQKFIKMHEREARKTTSE